MKKQRGITLISLVVTIIILIILAGISINLIMGDNGIVQKAKQASNEYTKQAATEKINLKITNIQISSYAEKGELPNLQYLADGLCKDEEMEYVALETKKTASLEPITVGSATSIFTKLKDYPYEFEINSSLQLASVDGVQIATSNNSGYDEKYAELERRIAELEKNSSNKNYIYEGNTIEILAGNAQRYAYTVPYDGIANISWSVFKWEAVESSVNINLKINDVYVAGSNGKVDGTYSGATLSTIKEVKKGDIIRFNAHTTADAIGNYGIILYKK